jgi:hypothetical protein
VTDRNIYTRRQQDARSTALHEAACNCDGQHGASAPLRVRWCLYRDCIGLETRAWLPVVLVHAGPCV